MRVDTGRAAERPRPAAGSGDPEGRAAGAYLVEWWPAAITSTVKIAESYAESHADSALGLADASLVALAEQLGTLSIATLDERHFRAVRPRAGGKAFRLLPADA
jgi:predicted nucleic acid-binding protein